MSCFSARLTLAVALIAGCGGASHSPRPDAGPIDSGSAVDSPPPPPGGDALAVAPHGTQLLASSGNVWLRGVTDDGLAIYLDTLTGNVAGLPIAGGPASLITRVAGQFAPTINVVGSAVAISAGTPQATAALWTARHGGMLLSSSGSPDVAVSSDGQYVLFFDAIGMDDVSLFAARTDGTARARLAYVRFPNPFDPTSCPGFKMGFAGEYAVAAFCERKASEDLQKKIQVASWRIQAGSGTPTWTRALHVPEEMEVHQDFAADRAATQVLVKTKSGLQVYAIDGGAPTTIDASGSGGAFTGDGKTVIYTTETNQLRRSAVAAPSPLTLLDRGAGRLKAVSPDEKTALVASGGENASRLLLASATIPGEPLFEEPGPVSSAVVFTADSAFAVYHSNRRLQAVPTSGPAAPVAVTMGNEVQWFRAAGGAKVVFEDWRAGSFSLWSIDLSRGAAAAPLVSDVSEAFVTAAGDQIVYRWHIQPGPLAGIWVTPIP